MNDLNLIRVYLTLAALLLGIAGNAQVNIGNFVPPAEGALLQLQNLPKENNGQLVNANKGLMLPRVNLTSITDLFPMFPLDYKKDKEDLRHTGLMVYNANDTLYNGDGKGLYYWDGAKWYGMGMVKRSIEVQPSHLYVSPVTTTATAQLRVSPKNLSYKSIDLTNGYVTKVIDAAGKITINHVPNKPGDGSISYQMKYSDKVATLHVHNLKLTLEKEIIKADNEATEINSSLIKAEGGDADWRVVSYSEDIFSWAIAPNNKAGKLNFKLNPTTSTGTVKGTIIVAHINDPNYTQTLQVWQNKDYIVLPEFDYLVVKYLYKQGNTAGRVDLDTATEINNTGMSGVDAKAVGWATAGTSTDPNLWQAYSLKYKDPITGNTTEVLTSAGDNTQDGYESVYSNMTTLRQVIPPTSPRELNVDMYGNWYYPTNKAKEVGNNLIQVSITLYKGGEMRKVGYDYLNYEPGTETLRAPVKVLMKDDLVVDKGNSSSSYAAAWREFYAPLLRLEYDRIDETGLIMRFTDIPQSTMRMKRSAAFSTAPEVDMSGYSDRPGDSKEEMAKRYHEYFLQQVQKSMQK